jgi:DNA integrity scanning protein DisA with diadenylate cyclase activity
MVASIENKREEKRNSRTQRKKSRKNLENFLEKTIAKEIEKIEKLEEIELLIEKSNGLLLNDLYTKDEKNSIQSSRKQLEKKKEELRNEGRSKKEKDLLITRLEISLKEANEKNYSLNKKIELLEKQQKT